jgi:hypothetical protein
MTGSTIINPKNPYWNNLEIIGKSGGQKILIGIIWKLLASTVELK